MSAGLPTARVWSPGLVTRKLPTVSLNVIVALALSVSAALAVIVNTPDAVGVPEMTPVEGSTVMPAGAPVIE